MLYDIKKKSMKTILTILLISFFTLLFGQNSNYEKWKSMAENDINLQPEYGNAQKSEEQIKSDNEFVEEILKHYKNKEEASKEMTKLGMNYLYEKGDFVTAMKRFNQAFLLNKENADVYYGYGTIYFNLGAFEDARFQYDKGLKLNPNHSEMLTDYGTTYLADFYENENKESLTRADEYLKKSLKIDDKNSNTIYKLSIVNMYSGNCDEANKYLKSAKKLKNPNVTEAFENELKEACKK